MTASRLRDLVSYAHKHNEANGEENRDGADHNLSWNNGVEGESEDAAIIAARARGSAQSARDAAVLARNADALHGRGVGQVAVRQ